MQVIPVGVGTALPETVIDNTEMVRILAEHGHTHTESGKELTAELLEKQIGIGTRRRVYHWQNTSDLALEAADQAIKEAGISWEQINIIRIGSSSPEAFFPSTACLTLSKAIMNQLVEKDLVHPEASDVLAACTSGIYGLVEVKRALADEPEYQFGLVIGAEVIASRMADPCDINTDLWGDGAGAMVLKKTNYDLIKPSERDPQDIIDERSGIICSILGTDPQYADLAHSIGKGTRFGDQDLTPNIYVQGPEIQRRVWKLVPDLATATIDKANRIYAKKRYPQISLQDVDMLFLHQSNGRFFNQLSRSMKFPMEKMYRVVHKYGNISSASVLIAFAEAWREGVIGKDKLVMLIAFGAGITYGSVLIQL